MIQLIQEASIGLWVAIYVAVFVIWLSLIKSPVEKRMKKEITEKKTTKKGAIFVLLNVMCVTVILPLTFLVMIYKLLSVGVQEEASFLLLVGLSVALSIINGLLDALLKKMNPNANAPFVAVFPFALIRLPFTMLRGIILWLFFAKLVGLWIENIFVIMFLAFLLNTLYSKIVDVLTGENKKETKKSSVKAEHSPTNDETNDGINK